MMTFVVSRDVLLSALTVVSGAVERRQTLPILSHLLFEIAPDQLRITATDLEIQLSTGMPVAEVKAPMTIAAPARKLLDICRALPAGSDIQCEATDNRLHLRSGRSHFQLALLPATDFPHVTMDASATSLSLPQDTLKKLLDKTAFAMAQQDVRYYLNGLLFEVDEKNMRVVATDGHRLALSVHAHQFLIKQALSVIVPRKAVVELSRLLSTDDVMIDVNLSMNHIHISHPTFQFTSKLIDGKFPDYHRVLPKNTHTYVYLDRDAFKQALTRAAILCNEKFHGVRFTFTADSLQIEANNPEQEQAVDEAPARLDGEPLQVGFNFTYIQDILSTLPEGEVKLSMTTSSSSVLFESENNDSAALYVVMPMRL